MYLLLIHDILNHTPLKKINKKLILLFNYFKKKQKMFVIKKNKKTFR